MYNENEAQEAIRQKYHFEMLMIDSSVSTLFACVLLCLYDCSFDFDKISFAAAVVIFVMCVVAREITMQAKALLHLS
jgi:hypothetical protein